MVETVYVLGYSGSGKTTTVHYLEKLVRDRGEFWSTSRFNDYQIMYDWFCKDSEHDCFRPTEYEGFDILHPGIYDKAIEELVNNINKHEPAERELMIIDFARWDYSSSFALLGKELLQNAYFLFLDAELKICEQRIRRRILNWKSIDDHFVPQSVFDCFIQQGTHYISSTISELIHTYGVSEGKITIINNGSAETLENLYESVGDFVNSLELTKIEVTV